MTDTASITLTALGTCGSYPGPGDACSGYLVETSEAVVWVDAGSGTLANLQRHVGLDDLDALFISHEHGDHWLDVPVLATALRYYCQRPPLLVVSNRATRERIEAIVEVDKLDEVFDWRIAKAGESVSVGDQTWRFFDAEHYVDTLAMEVTAGEIRVVYSADTGPGIDLSPIAEGPDACLFEATYPERVGHEGLLHLSCAEAGELAASIGAKSLILTHFPPGSTPDDHRRRAADTFTGPIFAARAGQRWAIGASGIVPVDH